MKFVGLLEVTSSLFIKQILNHHDPFGKIEYVPPHAPLFSMRTALNIFEDNEAVINTDKPKQKSYNASYITHTSCRYGLTI